MQLQGWGRSTLTSADVMVNLMDEDETNAVSPNQLFLSIMIGAITILMISSSAGPAIVKPLLLDGSLISDGRFAFVFENQETDVPMWTFSLAI